MLEGLLIYFYRLKHNPFKTTRDIQDFRKVPETARKVAEEHVIPDETSLRQQIKDSNNSHRLKEMSINACLRLHDTELPVQKKIRIDDSELMAQFMNLSRDLEDRTGKYSVQATLEHAIRLAHQHLEDVRSQDNKLSNVTNTI